MTTLTRDVILCFAVLLVSACHTSDDPDAQSSPDSEGCTYECSARMWPRLILSSTLSSDADLSPALIYADGTVSKGVDGCPVGIVDFPCTHVFYGAKDAGANVTLQVVTGGETLSTTIPLRAFNYCGREMAVVRVTEAADGHPRLAEPEYVSSGCSSP